VLKTLILFYCFILGYNSIAATTCAKSAKVFTSSPLESYEYVSSPFTMGASNRGTHLLRNINTGEEAVIKFPISTWTNHVSDEIDVLKLLSKKNLSVDLLDDGSFTARPGLKQLNDQVGEYYILTKYINDGLETKFMSEWPDGVIIHQSAIDDIRRIANALEDGGFGRVADLQIIISRDGKNAYLLDNPMPFSQEAFDFGYDFPSVYEVIEEVIKNIKSLD
jgi:hypothetical protein